MFPLRFTITQSRCCGGCCRASASARGPSWPPVPCSRLRRPRPPGGGGVWSPLQSEVRAEWDRIGVFGGEEEEGCVRSGPGPARTILIFHIIGASPSKQPLMVGSTLGVYSVGMIFVSGRTNKKISSSPLVSRCTPGRNSPECY